MLLAAMLMRSVTTSIPSNQVAMDGHASDESSARLPRRYRPGVYELVYCNAESADFYHPNEGRQMNRIKNFLLFDD
jgi:hypothetical protein